MKTVQTEPNWPKNESLCAPVNFQTPSESFQNSTTFAKPQRHQQPKMGSIREFQERNAPDCHNMGPINTEHRFDLALAQAWTWQVCTCFSAAFLALLLLFLWTTWHRSLLLALKDLALKEPMFGNVMLLGLVLGPSWAYLAGLLAILGLHFATFSNLWKTPLVHNCLDFPPAQAAAALRCLRSGRGEDARGAWALGGKKPRVSGCSFWVLLGVLWFLFQLYLFGYFWVWVWILLRDPLYTVFLGGKMSYVYVFFCICLGHFRCKYQMLDSM